MGSFLEHSPRYPGESLRPSSRYAEEFLHEWAWCDPGRRADVAYFQKNRPTGRSPLHGL